MKVMIMRKADAETEQGVMPSEELLQAMADYNEAMLNAGVLVDGTGLKPTSEGVRVQFNQGEPLVIDGPFAETKEQLAGFYLLDARDLNEAIQLAGNIPPARLGSIELRPIRELPPKK